MKEQKKVPLDMFLLNRMKGTVAAATKREDVVPVYAVCIILSQTGVFLPFSWYELNEPIICRWSFSALEYIKKKAWKIAYPFEVKNRKAVTA